MSDPALDYGPGVSLQVLAARAQWLSAIRNYFRVHNVLEVDVPVLGACTVTDPHLDALSVDGGYGYLQTSPEFFMKRLLAWGSGSIYFLGKAFRADESGRQHRPEFTLLEWYRTGIDDRQLVRDMTDLLRSLQPDIVTEQYSYGELFIRVLGVCPHTATAAELASVAAEHIDFSGPMSTASDWLDLLFSHLIQPRLQAPTFVMDYPARQCALARICPNDNGIPVARRFELFWKGRELANGYWELTDPHEQEARFQLDQTVRRQLGKPVPAYDQHLLAALHAGLPACSGVALGFDRLLMCLLDADDIAHVVPFAAGR